MNPAPVRSATPSPPGDASRAQPPVQGDAAPDLGRMMGSTPGKMRLWSVVCVTLVLLGGIFATLASVALTSSTEEIRDNTAPVLIKSQDVFASLAEANSAASAPVDDIEQRGTYLAAVTRASRDLEDVARLVGDDPTSHRYLKSIAEDLTTYSGSIEQARISLNPTQLRQALALVEDDIIPLLRSSDPGADTLTSRARAQLDEDIDDGTWQMGLALVAVAAAVLGLMVAQWWLQRRTRRLINLPLAVATILTIAVGVVLYSDWSLRQEALDVARFEGYSSIELTGEIQEQAFLFKSREAAVLAGEGTWDTPPGRESMVETLLTRTGPEQLDDLEAAVRLGSPPGQQGLLVDAATVADSDRERAAAAELISRWAGYLAVSDQIFGAQQQGELDRAAELSASQGAETYNGFNAAVESVLFDNRSQFEDAIDEAVDGLDWLSPLVIVLAGAAALFALWGFQQRIREYR